MSEFEPGAYDVEREVFSRRYANHLNCSDGMALHDQIALSNQLFDHFGQPRPEYRRRGGRPNYACQPLLTWQGRTPWADRLRLVGGDRSRVP